jgi:archaellum biogenesis protein FlaJ (TadC family)
MIKLPDFIYKLPFLKSLAGKKENQKPIKKEILDMDFFSLLSYMAAISTSGISRTGLFQHASNLPYISSRYFKKVDFVAKAFNHDYAEACRIVGEATKEPEVKAVLLRLSGAWRPVRNSINSSPGKRKFSAKAIAIIMRQA